MLMTNARLRGQTDLVDIRTEGDRIVAVTPAAGEPGDYDAGGNLVAPQFVEAHIHLDYANTAGQPRVNESGTLFEAIDIWQERKDAGLHTTDSVYANALAAAKELARHGVGHVRTHVDVTDPDLVGLHALRQLKDDVAEWLNIQIVAFPQNGVYAYQGGAELVEKAVAIGVDVLGAIPHLEPTAELGSQSLDFVFDLAENHHLPVDVHCDEIDDEHSRFIDIVTAQAASRSMGPQTVISHAVAMGYYSPGYVARLLPKMAAAEVNFAVCPNENLHLQGRGIHPTPRGVAPVRQLTEHGLNVAFCQDSLQDPWYPMGAGNLLRIADSGLHVSHMLAEPYLSRSLDFITSNPARNLGLSDDYGIAEGNRADLIVLDAHTDQDAIRLNADVLFSMHAGSEVLRQDPARPRWAVDIDN